MHVGAYIHLMSRWRVIACLRVDAGSNKIILAVGKLPSTSFTSLPNYCWILK